MPSGTRERSTGPSTDHWSDRPDDRAPQGGAHRPRPPAIVTARYDHDQIKRAGDTVFMSKALSFSISDHATRHMGTICLDRSNVPLHRQVRMAETETALTGTGRDIRPPRPGAALHGCQRLPVQNPGIRRRFPGSARRPCSLAGRSRRGGGCQSGACRKAEPRGRGASAGVERAITRVEWLANPDRPAGNRGFRYIGFPLRIKAGTGSPFGVVALFDQEQASGPARCLRSMAAEPGWSSRRQPGACPRRRWPAYKIHSPTERIVAEERMAIAFMRADQASPVSTDSRGALSLELRVLTRGPPVLMLAPAITKTETRRRDPLLNTTAPIRRGLGRPRLARTRRTSPRLSQGPAPVWCRTWRHC